MKAKQRLSDIQAMTEDQLNDEVLKLKKEQFNLRFQRATGQLENTARVRVIRRDIARMKTIAAQKRTGAEPVVKADVAPKTEKKTKSAKPKAAAKPRVRATKSKKSKK